MATFDTNRWWYMTSPAFKYAFTNLIRSSPSSRSRLPASRVAIRGNNSSTKRLQNTSAWVNGVKEGLHGSGKSMAEGEDGEKGSEGTVKGKELRFADVGINLTSTQYQGFYNHHSTPSHQPDLPSVISRASEAGVHKLMVTGSDLENSLQAIDLAKRYPGQCYATVGVHPCSAMDFEPRRKRSRSGEGGKENGGGEGGKEGKGEDLRGEELLAELERVARKGKEDGTVVAFGEFGLDYDRLGLCGKEVQERWFERQLEVAVKLQLPFFLHSRAAHTSFLNILRPYLPHLPVPPCLGLVHSFTGTLPELRELLSLGFHIGLNGCSFKSEENLEVVREVPLERLQLETDGPWCEIRTTHAGMKVLKQLDAAGREERVEEERWKKVKKEKWEEEAMVRGRNEPCEIGKVARVVAGVKGVSVQEVVDAAWRNSVGMFGLGVVDGEER
ncbi:MAG: hypothetical protein Q9166_002138 [cf. Caloplaca sp. 2 TL-2023]